MPDHHFAYATDTGYRCRCDEFRDRPLLDDDGYPVEDWTADDLTLHAYQHGLNFDSIQQPRVGLPATEHVGSDRYGGEVSDVSRTGHYVIFRSASGRESKYTRRQDGRYRPVGGRWGLLTFGVANTYLDPHF